MRKLGSHRFIEAYAETLPAMELKLRESARESVQASTWLVGLASGIVALLATKEGTLAALSSTQRPAVLLLMLSTVMFGVLQRLLFWIAEQREVSHFVALQGHLVGRIAALNAESAPILSESWSVAQIVDQIKVNFDLDYSFLVEYQTPIDKARDAYSQLYDRNEQEENEALDSFVETIMAYAGRTASQVQNQESLEDVRRQAKQIARLSRAATRCLGLTGLSFFAGLATLAFALI